MKVKLLIPKEGFLPPDVIDTSGDEHWQKGHTYEVPNDFHLPEGYFEKIEESKPLTKKSVVKDE